MNIAETICFGIESADNTRKNVAQVIDHSLKLFEYNQNGVRLSFNSSTTDTRGGGKMILKLENLK